MSVTYYTGIRLKFISKYWWTYRVILLLLLFFVTVFLTWFVITGGRDVILSLVSLLMFQTIYQTSSFFSSFPHYLPPFFFVFSFFIFVRCNSWLEVSFWFMEESVSKKKIVTSFFSFSFVIFLVIRLCGGCVRRVISLPEVWWCLLLNEGRGLCRE